VFSNCHTLALSTSSGAQRSHRRGLKRTYVVSRTSHCVSQRGGAYTCNAVNTRAHQSPQHVSCMHAPSDNSPESHSLGGLCPPSLLSPSAVRTRARSLVFTQVQQGRNSDTPFFKRDLCLYCWKLMDKVANIWLSPGPSTPNLCCSNHDHGA
jgi:hypothetical protein